MILSTCPPVCLFVCYKTREHDIFKINEPTLMQTDTWCTVQGHETISFVGQGSEVKVTRDRS